jgi:hypothetical protein
MAACLDHPAGLAALVYMPDYPAHVWRSVLPPELGQKLRLSRQTEGWSLRQAGRQIGIDWSYLRLLEGRQRCRSRSVTADLIAALEIPPNVAMWLRELAVPNAGRDWTQPEASRRVTGSSVTLR